MSLTKDDPSARRRTAARHYLASALVFSVACLFARPAAALPVSFTLTPAQSSIAATFDLSNLTGTVTGGPQKSGSLTSKYSGTVLTNLVLPPIAFPGGSNADAAQFSSKLSPAIGGLAGSDIADYGATFSAPVGQPIPPIDIPNVGTVNLGTLDSFKVDTALRNVRLDLQNTGGIPASGGAFDASQLTILPTGTVDVNLAAVIASPDVVTHFVNLAILQTLATQLPPTIPLSVTGSGNFITGFKINLSTGFSLDLAGLQLANQATNGSLAHVAANWVLTVPIDFDVVPGDALDQLLGLNVNFAGQLQGTAPFTALPEPATGALAVIACAIGGMAAWSRRRRPS
ncbi:MAG: hypothetical protein HYX69_09940 [Planctomycetia bacterium]|nr:hypothetical protein [Planctomycetia bacterium]